MAHCLAGLAGLVGGAAGGSAGCSAGIMLGGLKTESSNSAQQSSGKHRPRCPVGLAQNSGVPSPSNVPLGWHSPQIRAVLIMRATLGIEALGLTALTLTGKQFREAFAKVALGFLAELGHSVFGNGWRAADKGGLARV